MSVQELAAWLTENPVLIAYLVLLFAGSLVSFIVLAVRISRADNIGRDPIPVWPLANVDFALFMVMIVLWFILSGLALMRLHAWIAGPDAEPGANVSVLGGYLLQAGMLYLFLRFRFHYRNPNEGPVSPRLLPLGQSLLLGLFYFLASLPLVYGVSIVWGGVLELLRQYGVDIDLPLQDAVLLFREIDNPLVFYALLLLAVVVAPVVEESVFRAGVYRFLKGKTSQSFALAASGILFGMIHGNLQSLPGLVMVGVCLGLAYELSGSLRVPIFFHAFFNLNSILWILLLPGQLAG